MSTIYFDITKTGFAKYSSGLTRVSRRLLAELGTHAKPVVWKDGSWRDAEKRRRTIEFSKKDWIFTAELFSEAERPGFRDFIESRACRTAVVFHDAIPLKFPEISWPQAVRRAPDYMKLLAQFDKVLPVSDYSAEDLKAFWNWQGITPHAQVERLTLGANFSPATERVTNAGADAPAALVCVGILEPRKNQMFLLDVCMKLWEAGLVFDLHLAGRVNPHFEKALKKKIKLARETYRHLHFHESPNDAKLLELYKKCRAAVFPTIAEGCGLPPLEALWMGMPCVCSDLPVLREYTNAGGCLTAPVNHSPAWEAAIRRVLTDDTTIMRLRTEVAKRSLPTWAEAATALKRMLA